MAAAGLVAAVLLIRYRADLYHHAASLYVTHQCANYQASENQIVLRSMELREQLPPSESHFKVYVDTWSQSTATLSGSYAYFVPALRDKLAIHAPQMGHSGNATVFLHQRSSPDGARWLVVIDGYYDKSYNSGFTSLQLYPRTIARSTPWRMPDPCLTDGGFSIHLTFTDSFIVYAGQCDPTDDSHFQIRCRLGDKFFTLDGWINDDGTIKLGGADKSVPIYRDPPHGGFSVKVN
jgi:hypothetical protein